MADTPQATPQPQESQTPLFDMSKATQIQQPAAKPLFDMSKATPIQSDPVAGNPAFDLTAPRATGGQGPLGVGIGVGKGVVQTVAGAGELVNKVAPIIPPEKLAATEKWAEPNSPEESLGNMLEQGLEFATGEEVVNALGRVTKVEQMIKNSPMVARMVLKHPQIMKSAAKIVKQTTVGGAQGAVKGAAEGDALKGAEGGAAGAAIGSTVAEVGGAIAKPIANKMGIATTAEEDIMRAAKPGKRNDRFLQDWDIAKERYAKEMDANGKYEDLNDAAERMREQRQELWNTEVAPKIAKHANEDVFPNLTLPTANAPGAVNPKNNPISDAIRAKVTPAMQRLSPKSAKAIETIAQRFDGPMKVKELEENIEHLNAELTTEGFYKMSASERAAAVKANPSLAAKSAAVESSRDQLYNYLEKAGEPDIQHLKRTYGAMRNVENEVRGQVNVASRQNPISLKQIIGIASGHPIGIAATLLDKIYNEPANILSRAVRKNIPDSAVKSAAKDLVSRAGIVTKKAAPVVGAKVGQMVFIGGDGRKYLGDPEKWDLIQKADPQAKQVNP